MLTKLFRLSLVVLLVMSFSCEENNELSNNDEIENYQNNVSATLENFALQMELGDVDLTISKDTYYAGLSVASNFSSGESFRTEYLKAYTYGFRDYEKRLNEANSAGRSLSDDSLGLVVDLSAHDVDPHVQNFMVEILQDCYTQEAAFISTKIDAEIYGTNAHYYKGSDNVGLKFLITIKETAYFLYNNEALVLNHIDPSGRLLLDGGYGCISTFVASVTVFGAILGGAGGFVLGSFAPGPGNVAGTWAGAEAGAVLGAIVGGASSGIAAKLYCDEAERTFSDDGTRLYNPNGTINTSGIIASDLLVRNIKFSSSSNTYLRVF